jgi:hypothetical protein
MGGIWVVSVAVVSGGVVPVGVVVVDEPVLVVSVVVGEVVVVPGIGRSAGGLVPVVVPLVVDTGLAGGTLPVEPGCVPVDGGTAPPCNGLPSVVPSAGVTCDPMALDLPQAMVSTSRRLGAIRKRDCIDACI